MKVKVMPQSRYKDLFGGVHTKGEIIDELDLIWISLVNETAPFQIVFVNRVGLVGPTLFNFFAF